MIKAARKSEAETLWVATDGGRLYVESHGSGPALLLVHGWSLDHRSFAPQIRALRDRFRVIAYDRRGFGRSDTPPGLGAELDDIDRILDEFGIDDVHLVGVSQGGRIALRYALTRPDRIRALVLQGAMVDGVAAADDGDERIPIEEYVSLARAGRIDELRRRWLAHPMMQLRGDDSDARALVAAIVADYDARDLLDHCDADYRFDIDPLESIESFDRPVLVVTGEGETAARRSHAKRLVACAPDAREIVMTDSGHLANLEQSAAFNDALAAFLEDAETRLA